MCLPCDRLSRVYRASCPSWVRCRLVSYGTTGAHHAVPYCKGLAFSHDAVSSCACDELHTWRHVLKAGFKENHIQTSLVKAVFMYRLPVSPSVVSLLHVSICPSLSAPDSVSLKGHACVEWDRVVRLQATVKSI